MGLFKMSVKEKTELENFIDELPKSYLASDEDTLEHLLTYASDVKNNKISNPFKDEKTLVSVLIKYANARIENKNENISDYISQVKNVLNTIYITGVYDEDLELILNIFNPNGIYENNLFDINFYRIFDNILEYLTTMTSVLENNLIKENYDKISTFLINTRSTFASGDKFYFYTIAFLNKITIGTDIEKLIKDEQVRIDKKEGIYELDETTLDLIYEKTISAEGFLSELERLVGEADKISKRLTNGLANYKSKLNEINLDSLKEYKVSVGKGLDELKEYILRTKEELDKYAISKREEVSSKLIEEQDTMIKSLTNERDRIITSLKQFEETLSAIALAKTSEISRLGSEQLSQIDQALVNAPHIKEILSDVKGVMPDKEMIEAIMNLSKIDLKGLAASANLVTPTSSLVIPSPNVIIPEEPIDYTVNRYFDQSRSMISRLEELKEKMAKNTEEKGILYHNKTLTILEYLLYGSAPYLYGPSGGGKSMAVSLIADLLDLPMTNIGYINEEYQVTGAEPFLNNFTPSVIHITFKFGGLAFADELDNGNARATVVLNPFLRKTTTEYTFSNGELVKRHPNFRLITAGNTDGTGASKNHSTREGIEESVFQRLKPKVYIGYDSNIEKTILKDFPEWYNFILAFREALASYDDNRDEITLKDAVTTSDVVDIKEFLTDKVLTIEDIIQGDFIQAKTNNYLSVIETSLKKHYQTVKDKKELEIYETYLRCSKDYVLNRKLG